MTPGFPKEEEIVAGMFCWEDILEWIPWWYPADDDGHHHIPEESMQYLFCAIRQKFGLHQFVEILGDKWSPGHPGFAYSIHRDHYAELRKRMDETTPTLNEGEIAEILRLHESMKGAIPDHWTEDIPDFHADLYHQFRMKIASMPASQIEDLLRGKNDDRCR